MRVETGDLSAWAGELGDAAGQVLPEARQGVIKGAIQSKRDAKRKVSKLAHARHYARSITDDMRQGGDWVESEIGPDKSRRQGALGNLIEFGSVNNSPIPHMAPATDAEKPRFDRALEDLGARLLEGR